MWSFFGYNEGTGKGPSDSKINNEEIQDGDTEEEPLECDYEQNCTSLYKKIEEENWSAVSKFLETGYWPGNFFADPIPPADQVRTWVTRFNPNSVTGVRWSQLPLHLAIVVEAPYEVVGSLIELYPQAVRCTDDQHMLPLHLAMRHGSSDNVVDLLLAAFPEAVNAKGKNDRTPIECAVRGPNKVRARILGTFVERAKAKAAKSVTVSYSREISSLRAKLEGKEHELEDVKSKLTALDVAKAALQQDLAEAKSDDPSVTGGASIQMQITNLEQEKAALVEAQERASEEEKKLISELERVQMQVAKTASPEDLLALKEEIEALKNNRIKTQEQAQKEVEDMKKHIAEELVKADGSTREELQNLQNNIVELHRVASAEAGPDEDITTLKNEVEGLRRELERKEHAAKIRVDLSVLKEALTDELKDSDTKTEEQVSAITKALQDLKLSALDGKTLDELKIIKEEYDALYAEVKERRFADKLTEDVIKLRRRVDEVGESAVGKDIKHNLETIKKTLDGIKVAELQSRTTEQLASLNLDLAVLKQQLKDAEEITKIRAEFSELKTNLESDFKQSRGKKNIDSAQVKNALQKLKNMESKSRLELVSLKFELQGIQSRVRASQEAKELKEEFFKAIAVIDKHLENATGNVKFELTTIKTSLEQVDLDFLDGTNSTEMDVARDELNKAKKKLVDQELAMRLKAELIDIKESLKHEIIRLQHAGKKDPPALKEALAKVATKELDRKSTQELITTKEEVSALAMKLKEKRRIMGDIDAIKSILEELLLKKQGAVKEDLLTMKGTVDAIDLDEVDSDNSKEWENLKSQIWFLKKELEDADIADRAKQSLFDLKGALQAAIIRSEGETKKELELIKKNVDAIDIGKMDSDKREDWVTLMTEIDELKRALKVKECESLTSAIHDKIYQGRTSGDLSKVEISRITAHVAAIDQNFSEKSNNDLARTKEKLESILSETEPKEVHHFQNPIRRLSMKAGFHRKSTGSNASSIDRVPTDDKTVSDISLKKKTSADDKTVGTTDKSRGVKDKLKRFGIFARRRGKAKDQKAKGKGGEKHNNEGRVNGKEIDIGDAQVEPAVSATTSFSSQMTDKVERQVENPNAALAEEKKDDETDFLDEPFTPYATPAGAAREDKKLTGNQDGELQRPSEPEDVQIVETVNSGDDAENPVGEAARGKNQDPLKTLNSDTKAPTGENAEENKQTRTDQQAFSESSLTKTEAMKKTQSRTYESCEGGEVETVFVEPP